MLFNLSDRNLGHKVSLLVLGITLVVSLTISGVGELILRGVSADSSKRSDRIASLDRMVSQGNADLSPVTGIDG
ncbi:MAG TPA: HAMP domain-containing protein, partial [Anaerolineae bacterium]